MDDDPLDSDPDESWRALAVEGIQIPYKLFDYIVEDVLIRLNETMEQFTCSVVGSPATLYASLAKDGLGPTIDAISTLCRNVYLTKIAATRHRTNIIRSAYGFDGLGGPFRPHELEQKILEYAASQEIDQETGEFVEL